jgi:uncharacterized protein (DUF2141 family)
MMKAGTWLVTLMILMSSAVTANDRLAMRVSPAVAFAPATLSVRTTIEADAGNRSVEIVAESADFYRSSEIQLDGEAAPRTTIFQFRSLPTGQYAVRAILKGQGGHEIATVQRRVDIVESGTFAR